VSECNSLRFSSFKLRIPNFNLNPQKSKIIILSRPQLGAAYGTICAAISTLVYAAVSTLVYAAVSTLVYAAVSTLVCVLPSVH